ncbi:MAG: tetratricopeptide repeat protein, partial [Sodaliphilus sp.]|nr:tetratricopeptide repeat protein [Sodaliphilus sp.]
MKKFLYIAVAMVIGAMAVGLTGCKTAKMRDADEAYDRGEYFGAEKIYRKLYNKYTKKEERWIRGEVAYKLGLCYKRLNQSNRAAAAFQNAIRYEYPDSTQILYLAQAQHMQGNWKEALAS